MMFRKSLQLLPYILEIKKSSFPRQPLRRHYRAFGETAPRLGIMAQIDRIVERVQHDFMHTHYFTFAERNNFQLLATGFVHCPLDCQRSFVRTIFFLRLLIYVNLSLVAM